MVFINIEQNELKQNIYNEKEVIKKEIKEELEKLKPEIGLKNIKKFKENITEMINRPIQIGLMYTLGNAKLPKTTMIINLGTWFNCAGRKEQFCELCKKCYDKSPEVRFKERFFGRYNQEIMWRSLPAELIAETIIKELKKHNKVNLIRWAEVGELRNQNDLEKLIKISTIIGETTGIKSYIYTHNKSLDFTSLERPYLTINGSGFMIDNEYRVIEKELIENEFNNLNDLSNKRECICDCTKCSYCSTKQHYILIEEVR